MSAIGYVRLSPGERAAGGLGIAAQREAIAACAARLELELRAVYEDGKKSGGKDLEARPGLSAAIAALEEGDVLVVAKSDRLSRGDPVQAAFIDRAVAKRGARVVSADGEGTGDDSPSSIFVRRIVAAVAEYERLVIGDRTRKALAVKRARGERTGGVPYGWAVAAGGKLVQVLEEQRAIARMKELRAAGSSFREICRALELEGFRTKAGGPWLPATVRKILSSTR